jgi:hypothetical protein
MIACFKVGLYWQGLMHDLSKFRPSEFFPYANYFYGKPNSYFEAVSKYGCYEAAPWGSLKEDIIQDRFDFAWLLHQKRNPHHWQYWILIQDEDGNKILEMPKKYLQEMICDWSGAGKAQGKYQPNELQDWYNSHKDKMQLNPITANKIIKLLQEAQNEKH